MSVFGTKNAIRLLQMCLAFVFLYAAISQFINPDNWYGYLPAFLYSFIPTTVLLKIFAVSEIILSIWILSGWKRIFSSAAAALMLAGIFIFNIKSMDIVFRDFGLFFAALALFVLSKNPK